MTIKEIDALAELARLRIGNEEKENLLRDFESILSYIGEINSAEIDTDAHEPSLIRNVMREDENPREPGTFTRAMLAEAPLTEDGYIKVKQVL